MPEAAQINGMIVDFIKVREDGFGNQKNMDPEGDDGAQSDQWQHL